MSEPGGVVPLRPDALEPEALDDQDVVLLALWALLERGQPGEALGELHLEESDLKGMLGSRPSLLIERRPGGDVTLRSVLGTVHMLRPGRKP